MQTTSIMLYTRRLTVLLLFVFYLSSCGNSAKHDFPKAKQGEINIVNWNFQKDGIVKLDGDWEFYWQELLTPADFRDTTSMQTPNYFAVPKLWRSQVCGNIALTSFGFATYRLVIHCKPSTTLFALKTERIETAHKMWVNGKLLLEHGVVADNEKDMRPQWFPTEIYIPADTSTLEIVLQVSNFVHRKGGISQSISIGTPYQIAAYSKEMDAFVIFVLGVMLIMCVYHFGLFFLRRKDPSTLYFGLVCLFTGINSLTTGEILLVKFFPDFWWEGLVKINYITNYLRLAFFPLFVGVLFRAEFSKKFLTILLYFCYIMSAFVIVTPASIYTHTLILFELTAVVSIGYLLFALTKAVIKHRDGALYSLTGTLILFAAMINDILHDMLIIHTFYLVSFGMFVFIFFQAFMLALRSAKSFTEIEKLSERLLSIDRVKNQLLNNPSFKLNKSLRIILESLKADKAYLILGEGESWKIEAGGMLSDRSGDVNKAIAIDYNSKELPLLSYKIFQKVLKSKKPILINNACQLPEYQYDTYIHTLFVKSVLCFPILKQAKIVGVIYFENNVSENAFNEEHQHILDLLSSQISTLIDNSRIFHQLQDLNRNLESKVQERTAEVYQQNEEIQAQRDEIEATNADLHKAYEQLSIKNNDLKDSINYARRIQESILPSVEFIQHLLPESFVFFQPRDVLSGDFYWFEHIYSPAHFGGVKTERIYAAAVDCTGHGVPGALMSIIANNLLNYAVNEMKVFEPAAILDVIQEGVRVKLKQTDEKGSSRDGMDISLICFDVTNKTLQYAGAKNPLYLIRNGLLIEYQADKFSIGGIHGRNKQFDRRFTNNQISIQKHDTIYLTTDGFADQFGSEAVRKFMYPRFRQMLVSNSKENMASQKEIMKQIYNQWKGNLKQIDDVLVIGIRFDSLI